MLDNNHGWLGLIPFILQTGEGVRMNKARILEALIIAAVSGIVSAYILVQKLEVKLQYIERMAVTTQEDLKQHIIWDLPQGDKK